MIDPAVYVVLDRAAAAGRDLRDVLDAALRGGSRMVQLREKTLGSGRQFGDLTGRLLALARDLRSRCREAGATFVVNDRVDLAVAVEADGVHLGQDDLPIAEARRLLPRGALVGVSTHDRAQALAAVRAGADYVAVGALYPTTTKAGFQLVGPGLVRELRAEIPVPLVGIGGITAANAGEVAGAGADGVAVISAVCAAADPEAAARELLTAFRRGLRGRRADGQARLDPGARFANNP